MSELRNVIVRNCFRIIAILIMLLVPSAFIFAGGQDEGGNEPVELVWYQFVGNTMPDEDVVFEELNKYLAEKIGVVVKPYFFTYDDFNSKMPVIISSGQPFDITFTSGWTNHYLPNVSKGAFLPLNDLLNTYAAETEEYIPDALWDAVKVQGDIYGVPIYKEVGHQYGFYINKELAEKYNMDVDRIETFWDIIPFLETIKANEPGVIPWFGTGAYESALPMEHLAGSWTLPGAANVPGLEAFANQGKVFNQYATPEYRDFVKRVREMHEAGLNPSNVIEIVTDGSLRQNTWAANELFSMMLWYAPLAELNFSQSTGVEALWIPAMPPVFESTDAFGGLHAISANTQYPEKAVEFLNLLTTDQTVATMLRYGVEGVHYELVNGQVDSTATGYTYDNHPYYQGFGWFLGSPLNQIWDVTHPANATEVFLDYNTTTIPTTNLGFVFDPESVQNEVAALENVLAEYLTALNTGSVDPDVYLPRFLDALEANGADTLIAEVQRQLDAYHSK